MTSPRKRRKEADEDLSNKKVVIDLDSEEVTPPPQNVASPTKTTEPREPAGTDDEEVDDRCLCPLCLQLLFAPCLLPCKHSYCLGCLKRYVPEEALDFACPQCRRTTTVDALKKHDEAEERIKQLVGEGTYAQRSTEAAELEEAYTQRKAHMLPLTIRYRETADGTQFEITPSEKDKLAGVTVQFYDIGLEGVAQRSKAIAPFLFTIPEKAERYTLLYHLPSFFVVAADLCQNNEGETSSLTAVHPFVCEETILLDPLKKAERQAWQTSTATIPYYHASSAEMDAYFLFCEDFLSTHGVHDSQQRQQRRAGLWDLISGEDLPDVYDAQDGLYVPRVIEDSDESSEED